MATAEKDVTSLSIIENINLTQVSNTMGKIAQFQSVVQKTLKKDHDYGVIPGTSKPTLLKPGAEKILMLMGVSSEYTVTEKVQDYDNGFFAFTVKCVLSKNGLVITEGVGHCNTREKKYVNQDPYTLANTCLKMAKKRAQIDATLTIASLSEVFTQDVEDLPQEGSNGNGYQKAPKLATNKQLGLIKGRIDKAGFDHKNEATVKMLLNKAGLDKETLQELTIKEASDMINNLDTYLNQMADEMAAGQDQATMSFDDKEDVPF